MKISIRKKAHNDRLWIIRSRGGRYLKNQVGFIRLTFTPSYQVRNDLSREKDRFLSSLKLAKEAAVLDFAKIEGFNG